MKIKDIHIGETTQKTENENKYIPGSSEKKRACMMYLFFGIIVSISKKEFSPFELYHFKQSIGLWILILPVVLISFIPVIRWIGIIVLVVLLAILGISFSNAWNGKYFDNSSNAVFALFAGIGGWFLDLFELGIKSTGVEQKSTSPDLDVATTSELEKNVDDSTDSSEKPIVDDLQNQDTSLQEDVERLGENDDSGDNTSEGGKA